MQESPQQQLPPVTFAIGQWLFTLVATLFAAIVAVRGKGMRALRAELQKHITKDEQEFQKLTNQVRDVDRKLTRVAAIQSMQTKRSAETHAIIEKIRDQLLREAELRAE